MIDIGRVCIKIAGRDAGKLAVVIGQASETIVLVDGNVRRRKCNIKHLEPVETVLKVKENASTEEVFAAMKEAELPVEKNLVKKKEENKVDKK